MKKIDLAQTVSLLANIGVIAGIVFLGYELRQNNAFLASQSRANQVTQQAGLLEFIANPQILAIADRVEAGNDLTAGEQIALQAVANRLLDFWEWQYIESEAGMLERDQVPVFEMRRWFGGALPLPAPVRLMWDVRRDSYSDGFIDFVEQNVIDSAN